MEGLWRTTAVGVIRKRSWKLRESFQPRGSANRWEFDDLQNDIGERVNLAGENPDIVRELLRDMVQWRETVGAAIPQKPNPRYDTHTESDEFDGQQI